MLSAIRSSADCIWVGCDEQPLGGCEGAAKFYKRMPSPIFALFPFFAFSQHKQSNGDSGYYFHSHSGSRL